MSSIGLDLKQDLAFSVHQAKVTIFLRASAADVNVYEMSTGLGRLTQYAERLSLPMAPRRHHSDWWEKLIRPQSTPQSSNLPAKRDDLDHLVPYPGRE